MYSNFHFMKINEDKSLIKNIYYPIFIKIWFKKL